MNMRQTGIAVLLAGIVVLAVFIAFGLSRIGQERPDPADSAVMTQSRSESENQDEAESQSEAVNQPEAENQSEAKIAEKETLYMIIYILQEL